MSTYFYLMFMTKTLSRTTDKATTLAFIFGGRQLINCWSQGSEDNKTLATQAGKHFKRCNKHLYKFPKRGEQKLVVHLFDISNAQGWSMDYRDICTCLETKQECPYIEKIYVVV